MNIYKSRYQKHQFQKHPKDNSTSSSKIKKTLTQQKVEAFALPYISFYSAFFLKSKCKKTTHLFNDDKTTCLQLWWKSLRTFHLSVVGICEELANAVRRDGKWYSWRNLQSIYADDISVLETANREHNIEMHWNERTATLRHTGDGGHRVYWINHTLILHIAWGHYLNKWNLKSWIRKTRGYWIYGIDLV